MYTGKEPNLDGVGNDVMCVRDKERERKRKKEKERERERQRENDRSGKAFQKRKHLS